MGLNRPFSIPSSLPPDRFPPSLHVSRSEEHVDIIVEEGAIDALVPHLSAPPVNADEGEGPVALEHEVEKEAAFAIGLLAIKVGMPRGPPSPC